MTLSVYATEAEAGADESAPVHEDKGADPMQETQETFRKNVGGLYGPLKARSEKEAEMWSPGIKPEREREVLAAWAERR